MQSVKGITYVYNICVGNRVKYHNGNVLGVFLGYFHVCRSEA